MQRPPFILAVLSKIYSKGNDNDQTGAIPEDISRQAHNYQEEYNADPTNAISKLKTDSGEFAIMFRTYTQHGLCAAKKLTTQTPE